MSKYSSEAVVTAVCIVLLVILVIPILLFVPSTALAFGLGIPAGVISGLLLSLVVFFSQQPDLTVTVSKDEFNPNLGGMYFLHVVVRNNASGFLGGGVASDCIGELKLGETKFTPKWATKPEPLSWNLVQVGTGGFTAVPIVDPSLMEQCKIETIGSQEEKVLDVAMKVAGDDHCFIHTPENYYAPDHKRNPYPVGTYDMALTLKYRGGKYGPVWLRLNNGAGTVPTSLILTLKPQ